jgi:hypothetical protein
MCLHQQHDAYHGIAKKTEKNRKTGLLSVTCSL